MLYLELKLWSKDLPPVLPTLLIPLHLIAASLTYVPRKLCCQLGKFFSFSDGKCHNKSSVSAVASQICFLFRLCFSCSPPPPPTQAESVAMTTAIIIVHVLEILGCTFPFVSLVLLFSVWMTFLHWNSFLLLMSIMFEPPRSVQPCYF